MSIVDLKSKILIVLSVEPVAIRFSYLLKSQDRISLSWAFTDFTALNVRKSQILKVSSPEHEAIIDSCVGCHTD